jgi:outer membrane protein assembly factor BamB
MKTGWMGDLARITDRRRPLDRLDAIGVRSTSPAAGARRFPLRRREGCTPEHSRFSQLAPFPHGCRAGRGVTTLVRGSSRALLVACASVLPLVVASGGAFGFRQSTAAGPVRPRRVLRLEPRQPVGYDWLQFNLDARHAGNNPLEVRIGRDNVAALKKLFRVPILDVVDGAAAYLARVATPAGVRDLLFATSAAGFVLAHDACTGTRVWFRGPSVGTHWTTSSPAVDPDRRFIYSYQTDGYVHKFRVEDGTEVTAGGWPELVTRKPEVEKGSSPISILASNAGRRFLYMSTAGYPGDPGDEGDYQGHVTAIDLETGSQRVFNALCSDRPVHFDQSQTIGADCPHVRAGIWGRAGIVYDASTDRVLFTTGNGDFDAHQGGRNWGSSVLSLPPDLAAPGGLPSDSYTPREYQRLADDDLDLGSSSPLILPRAFEGLPARAVQAGKDAQLRLLDLSNLSGQGGPGHIGGELAVVPVPQGGEVLTAPAAWSDPEDRSVWVFVATERGLAGLQLENPAGARPTLSARWTRNQGGSSPIVANGVLYHAGGGFIAALDPRTGQELWSDHDVGNVHWQSPILVNGVLYMTDNTPTLFAWTPDGVAAPRSDGPCR